MRHSPKKAKNIGSFYQFVAIWGAKIQISSHYFTKNVYLWVMYDLWILIMAALVLNRNIVCMNEFKSQQKTVGDKVYIASRNRSFLMHHTHFSAFSSHCCVSLGRWCTQSQSSLDFTKENMINYSEHQSFIELFSGSNGHFPSWCFFHSIGANFRILLCLQQSLNTTKLNAECFFKEASENFILYSGTENIKISRL